MDIKKYILPAILIGFAIFMYTVNTQRVNELFDNPMPNYYYVTKNYPDKNSGELVFKVREVRPDSIVLLVPHSQFATGFKVNKSESKVKESNMFGDETLTISRNELKQMKENESLAGATSGKPMIFHVFK
jgi:hypothetical protein